jgi:hypothetical protein
MRPPTRPETSKPPEPIHGLGGFSAFPEGSHLTFIKLVRTVGRCQTSTPPGRRRQLENRRWLGLPRVWFRLGWPQTTPGAACPLDLVKFVQRGSIHYFP